MTEGTVSAATITMLTHALQERGIDTVALIEEAGLPSSWGANARLPASAGAALWQAAVRATGDDDLGIHLAAHRGEGTLGVFDYAVSTAASLGAGWQRMARYFRLLHDSTELTTTVTSAHATLRHRLVAPYPPRIIAEFVLGSVLVLGRKSTGVQWSPIEVRFAHKAPIDDAPYRAFFSAPIHYGAGDDALVVTRETYELPNQRVDAHLSKLIDGFASELLAKLPPRAQLESRVRALVLPRLADKSAGIAAIATELGMSSRNLSRRLADEGTSFSRVVDQLRQDSAKAHVSAGKLSNSEIAYLLGFSEPSAFHRAFRRWTGTTPGRYRS